MALTDIDFQEGEGQDFLLEIATGTLNAPFDALVETSGAQFPLVEIEQPSGGGDEIFILND